METLSARRIGCLIMNRRSFWSMVGYGVASRFENTSITVESYSGEERNEAEIVHQFAASRVDAMILAAHQHEQLRPILAKVDRSVCPIIAVGVALPEDIVTTNVVVDDSAGAERCAEYLLQQIGGVGAIAHIQGDLSMQTGINRSDALHRALARYPQVQLAYEAQTYNWDYIPGYHLMREALAANPHICGVFAASDPAALGALKAIDEAGRAGTITVVGFDGQPDGLAAIFDGHLAATVDQPAYTLGWQAADALMRYWQGEQLPKSLLIAANVITPETVKAKAVETLRLMPGLFANLMAGQVAQQKLQDQMIHAQQALIRELSTPILPISDDILVLPLVGSIDSARAMRVTEVLLAEIARTHAHSVIIDISGVPVVDTGVANHLLQTATAVRLLGATPFLVGISPELAATIVQLGIDLSSVVTCSTLSVGLSIAQAAQRRATRSASPTLR